MKNDWSRSFYRQIAVNICYSALIACLVDIVVPAPALPVSGAVVILFPFPLPQAVMIAAVIMRSAHALIHLIFPIKIISFLRLLCAIERRSILEKNV